MSDCADCADWADCADSGKDLETQGLPRDPQEIPRDPPEGPFWDLVKKQHVQKTRFFFFFVVSLLPTLFRIFRGPQKWGTVPKSLLRES